MAANEQLRALPAVDQVLVGLAHLEGRFPRTLIVDEIRRALHRSREEIRSGRAVGSIEQQVEKNLVRLEAPSLRHVINATGVVLHTNLGRAPLGTLNPLARYSNLEYDVGRGLRGKRDVHVGELLERIAGAPGIAVNNNAAAIYLALNELAAGFEVVVSRGELIEIGDGFRIPEIMRSSGALLTEVGTTNRTHIDDFRDAINDRTRLLLRVHPSNFRMEGFTARPSLKELVTLGRERGIPVYEDLGSGCVADLRAFGIDEPLAGDSLRAGANLVSFSGDKLLGGPQAGILAGDAEIVGRLRRNPMFRALRLDKLIYQFLENTLRNLLLERWDQIPALSMIRQSPDKLRERAENLVSQMDRVPAEIVQGKSLTGGGATPDQPLPTWLIAIGCKNAASAEQSCRQANPPLIARIQDDRLLLDLRTVFPEEEADVVRIIGEIMATA